MEQGEELAAFRGRKGAESGTLCTIGGGLDFGEQTAPLGAQREVHAAAIAVIDRPLNEAALRKQLDHQTSCRSIEADQTPERELIDAGKFTQCCKRAVLRRGNVELAAVMCEERCCDLMTALQQEARALVNVSEKRSIHVMI